MSTGRAVELECCRCKTQMWLPEALYTAAKHDERIYFFCAYGHQQHFAPGETEADKLRRELNRMTQRVAQKDDQIREERDKRIKAEAATQVATRKLGNAHKRASAGVCLECHRTFQNVARHMANKHGHPVHP